MPGVSGNKPVIRDAVSTAAPSEDVNTDLNADFDADIKADETEVVEEAEEKIETVDAEEPETAEEVEHVTKVEESTKEVEPEAVEEIEEPLEAVEEVVEPLETEVETVEEPERSETDETVEETESITETTESEELETERSETEQTERSETNNTDIDEAARFKAATDGFDRLEKFTFKIFKDVFDGMFGINVTARQTVADLLLFIAAKCKNAGKIEDFKRAFGIEKDFETLRQSAANYIPVLITLTAKLKNGGGFTSGVFNELRGILSNVIRNETAVDFELKILKQILGV